MHEQFISLVRGERELSSSVFARKPDADHRLKIVEGRFSRVLPVLQIVTVENPNPAPETFGNTSDILW